MAESHVWTHQETLLLLDCYRAHEPRFSDGKITKDYLFKKVAEDLNFENPNIFGNLYNENKNIVAKLCDSKIADLKKKYKDVLKKRKKTGNKKSDWVYFEILHEIFYKKPWIEPLSVAGSDIPFKGLVSNEPTRKRKSSTTISTFKRQQIDLMEKDIEIEECEREDKQAHELEKTALLTEILAHLKR